MSVVKRLPYDVMGAWAKLGRGCSDMHEDRRLAPVIELSLSVQGESGPEVLQFIIPIGRAHEMSRVMVMAVGDALKKLEAEGGGRAH